SLTRGVGRSGASFIRNLVAWAASRGLLPFKEEVRGSNPLRATESMFTPRGASRSRSRSRLRRPRLREIVPDGGLHDRLERRFIELLVLRDIDRPRLAQELRVEELLRVRKA